MFEAVRRLDALRKLLPVAGAHAMGYVSLIGADAELAFGSMRRRVYFGIGAFMAAWLSIALGIVWIVAAAWDSPNRLWWIGGLTLGLAAVAVALGLTAGRKVDQPFSRVRAEWAADRDMLRRLSPNGPHVPQTEKPHG